MAGIIPPRFRPAIVPIAAAISSIFEFVISRQNNLINYTFARNKGRFERP
jgi:hypothetical protein